MFSNIAVFSFTEQGNQKLPGYAQGNHSARTALTLCTSGALLIWYQLSRLCNGQLLQNNGSQALQNIKREEELTARDAWPLTYCLLIDGEFRNQKAWMLCLAQG